ncbi:MAG: adenosylcobinamide-phosphate synthase CbiB [Deltaproteobacteria bacterium]|nr:adenosylcobinamide-phosphate synthase CbiB [Deltaproteobacteria bacterium]
MIVAALTDHGLAALALAAALAIDLAWGEPPIALHPVVWMGRMIAACERRAPRRGPLRQLGAGAAIALAVPLAFIGLGAAVASAAPSPLAFLLAIWLLTSSFAIRALGHAAFAVRDALARDDLPAARDALRSLCSRDPRGLDGPELAAAAVESVAENASDSVVAPLFYYALFGLPGALGYRAVNTLDARLGYRGRYEYLGKASARLDDLLNLVPARLTAALLLVAGALSGADARRGWAIWRRDAGATASPNAGRPMATMAGLLGVQLVKPGHYRLGDPGAPLTASTIDHAWRIVHRAALSAAAIALAAVLARGL